MRLIDADAIPEVSWDQKEESAFRATINKMPTIDAEPVRRGRWVEGSGMFMCSVCHDVWSTENEEMIKGFNYCPWCGAKMEDE